MAGSGPRPIERDHRRRWPYLVGVTSVTVAWVGLLLAPFGAIVYVALPGIALATWFAFADAWRARIGLAISLGALAMGLATGIVGLTLAAAGTVNDSFAAQEWGFAIGAAALWLFPLIGLIVASVSLAIARVYPATRMPVEVMDGPSGF